MKLSTSVLAFALITTHTTFFTATNNPLNDLETEYLSLAQSCKQEHNEEKALQYYEQALRLNDNNSKAHYEVGQLYLKKKQYTQALFHFQIIQKSQPEYINALYQCGIVYKEKDELEKAATCFEHVLEHNKRHMPALLHLGNTRTMLNDCAGALTCYQTLLDRNPSLLQVQHNYAYTLKKMGCIKEAITIFDQIIQQKPDYAQARFARSLSYLMLGNFEQGWPEYEWRWAAYNETPKKFSQPVWDGSNPAGKRILIYAEQGLGDTFQFVRYLQLIKEQGGYVIFQAQKPLKTLLSLCNYIDEVVTGNDPLPRFDYQIPLMSLPMVYKTQLSTVPNSIPYLHPKKELVELWKEKLAHDTNFKIGLCWQGNSQYRSVFLKHAVSAKSMSLEEFAPLGSLEGVSFYSLQKINGQGQLNKLDNNFFVHELGPNFDETHGRFMDTAAVITQLDLVISVDTSICHLAAALGTPVWVPLPYPADWRWMVKRTDTPWYPNMRLFRQKQPGNWQSVIQSIVHALENILGAAQPYTTLTDQNNNHLQIEPEEDVMLTLTEYLSTVNRTTTQIVADLIDRITQVQICHTHNPQNKSHIKASHIEALHVTVEELEKQHPTLMRDHEIILLSKQLLECNNRIWDLSTQLPPSTNNYFSQKINTTITNLAELYTCRNYLKQQIYTRAAQLLQGDFNV